MKRIADAILIFILVVLMLLFLVKTGALAQEQHVVTLPLVYARYDMTLPTPAPTIGDPWRWPIGGAR